jgi:acyl-coenzyme A synthetase/AMP-(fatty) acid ligase
VPHSDASIQWLLDRMAEARERDAIIWRDQHTSHGQLLDLVSEARQALDAYGLKPGRVVSLEADYSPRTVAMLLAIIDRAAIVVPLTAAVRAEREEFLDIAEVQDRITVDAEDNWKFASRGVEPANALTRQLVEAGHPGLVLFSSGSTGRSKAALHNMTPLLDKFKVRRHTLRTLIFLLLDHIGGQNTLYYILSNAGTIISIDNRDPDAVCAAIEQYQVELLPTSPTFLNLLLISEAYRRYDLSSLKRVTYGTEVMPESTLTRLHQILPNVDLLQTYGLSELGILRSKSRDSSSLWVKVGGEGFETKIVDGILWIKARSAMLGYLNHPSPFDEEGWFNTGDMVEVDGEWIRILGRQSEIINVGGQKVYPAEVESVLLQMPNVHDVMVLGEKNPITGNIVVAKFNLEEPESPSDLKRRMREYCRDRLTSYKVPVKIEIVDDEQYSARFKKIRRAKTVAA